MAEHQRNAQDGASPDEQVWTIQLRTEMCLNTGLNCSFCSIFNAITERMFLLYGLGFLNRLAPATYDGLFREEV